MKNKRKIRILYVLGMLFVFLGPLGNLLTPAFFPLAFRTYYFVLPLFFLYYGFFTLAFLKNFSFFLPFFFYCLASVAFMELSFQESSKEALFRFFLLFSQFAFVLGFAFYLRNHLSFSVKNKLVNLFLLSFFISLIVGYIIFFCYELKLISFEVAERFTILTQINFNLLRFSPGSYPNEYGLVSSFALSILTLFVIDKKRSEQVFKVNIWLLRTLFVLTFLALFLTTTRAAYISYVLSLIYLSMVYRAIDSVLLKVSLFCMTCALIIGFFGVDLFAILAGGIKAISFNEGSTGERFEIWAEGFEKFIEHYFVGLGFSKMANDEFNIHNLYLQLGFELGVIGIILLIGGLLLFIGSNIPQLKMLFFKKFMDEKEIISNRVIVIGLIHVVWFAFSNHNLNHFLTWYVFLLIFIGIFSKQNLQYLKNKPEPKILQFTPP